MNTEVYRMIVKSVMTRMPREMEQVEDFFIGFDGCDRPYLLLPTPDQLGEDYLFAIRLVRDPLNKFRYALDSHFTRMPFRRFRHFYDDKTYFFGPKDNMLQQFLKGATYRIYTEWIHNLCGQPHLGQKKQIS
ncbi:MAG TPA: hypothetical protein VFK33_14875 [Bacillales bacterium]|nr:hypothetical protein [Bacillales bacterium]